jgi:thiol-disulfide isomerase/thioredoxin
MTNKVLQIILLVILVGYVINYFYRKPKLAEGQKALDFSAELISGEKFQLTDLRGRYVLLDFWGSWCGPCRKENPALVELYHETRDKTYKDASGFDIISVAIETKKSAWLKAVQSDGLVWPYQIGEFERFSSPVASLYKVREIPTKYLLDTSGVVILVNPKVEDIRQFLKDRQK